MDLRSCLRKTLDQTGFVCVSDGRFFCNYAMLEKMEKMLLHRHHSFLRLGFHRRIHLLPISRSDKVTQGGNAFFNTSIAKIRPLPSARGTSFWLSTKERLKESCKQRLLVCSAGNISTILLNAPWRPWCAKWKKPSALFLRRSKPKKPFPYPLFRLRK